MAFDAVSVKVPILVPFADSHPAHGWPACNAVNLATVLDVLMPVALGFATNSKAGFVPFSNVVHPHVAPFPPVSKSIGLVCENPILDKSMNTLRVIIFFLYNCLNC